VGGEELAGSTYPGARPRRLPIPRARLLARSGRFFRCTALGTSAAGTARSGAEGSGAEDWGTEDSRAEDSGSEGSGPKGSGAEDSGADGFPVGSFASGGGSAKRNRSTSSSQTRTIPVIVPTPAPTQSARCDGAGVSRIDAQSAKPTTHSAMPTVASTGRSSKRCVARKPATAKRSAP